MSGFDWFFKFAPKDPIKKANYDYYLFWVIFLAFLLIGGDNLYRFLSLGNFTNLGWAVVMFIIAYFNYNTLKAMYESRKMLLSNMIQAEKSRHNRSNKVLDRVENVKEMMDEFK